jgi:hypothetical protein
MATKTAKNQTENESEVSEPVRTEPMTIGPSEGGNAVLAAWRGLANLFGAQAERFDITSDGVVAVNVTFDGNRLDAVNAKPDQIISDVAFRSGKLVERRLDLLDLYDFVTHPENSVEPYTDSGDMTQWMVNHLKGAGNGDGSRSPDYAKEAIRLYKEERGIAAPRGRRRKILRLDNLKELRVETIAGVPLEELNALRETIAQAIAIQSSESTKTANA